MTFTTIVNNCFSICQMQIQVWGFYLQFLDKMCIPFRMFLDISDWLREQYVRIPLGSVTRWFIIMPCARVNARLQKLKKLSRAKSPVFRAEGIKLPFGDNNDIVSLIFLCNHGILFVKLILHSPDFKKGKSWQPW